MYGSPPIKSLEKHKWNIRIVRAKINSEKIELETSYEKAEYVERFIKMFFAALSSCRAAVFIPASSLYSV